MSCYTTGRQGRSTRVLAAKETAYGTLADFSAATLYSMAVKCEMTPIVNTTDIDPRTGTKIPQDFETIKTTTGGTVVLSGAFNDGYEWLLEAYTGDSTSPHSLSDSEDPSYEIHRQHTDGTPKDDIALGCVLETFNFTGEQGGVLTFEATFSAQSITWEAATEGTYTAPTIKPFQFAGSSITDTEYTLTAPTSYSCNLSATLLEDDISYGNSATRVCNSKQMYSGEISYEALYLSGEELDVADMQSTSVDISATFYNGVSTTSGTKYIEIKTSGKFMREAPDPDAGMFKGSLTQTLGGAKPLEITYDEVA